MENSTQAPGQSTTQTVTDQVVPPPPLPPSVRDQLAPWLRSLTVDVNVLVNLAAKYGASDATISAKALATLVGRMSMAIIQLQQIR